MGATNDKILPVSPWRRFSARDTWNCSVTMFLADAVGKASDGERLRVLFMRKYVDPVL
jgi:hypothetical protein